MNTITIQIDELRRGGPSEAGCTIFRVPAHVCQGREHLFRPRTVSIGPYHRGHPELADMEKVKLQFLSELLPTERQLRSCMSKLEELEGKARRCYFHSAKLDSKKFVQMLLKDGCFIIQFLLIIKDEPNSANRVYEGKWIQNMIIRDLLLLENQIPFFVLQTLYDHIAEINPGLFVVNMKGSCLFELIDKLFITMPMNCIPTPKMDYHHLVHLCHCICFRVKPSINSEWSFTQNLRYLNLIKLISTLFSCILFKVQKQLDHRDRRPPRSIPSVTRLGDAGVAFKKMKRSSSGLLDMSFTDGVLEIQPITLSRETKFLLANLVVFEQWTGDKEQGASSYAIVMDHLVDTPEDVELLVRTGILESMLPSNEEVARFFNQLSNSCHLNYDDHKFKQMFEEIENYNRTFWHAWRAKLVRDYFSNPWSVISLVAAILLLTLTLIQTIFTVLSYFRH